MLCFFIIFLHDFELKRVRIEKTGRQFPEATGGFPPGLEPDLSSLDCEIVNRDTEPEREREKKTTQHHLFIHCEK